MEVKILRDDKNDFEIELDNLTIAELLRSELWNDSSVKLAAWRREHPEKSPVLILKTEGKTARKVLADCIERIEKINGKLIDDFKKSIK